MVAVPVCPTHQPAGAAWYRWFTPSVSSDTLVTLKNLYGFQKSYMGHEKPAKSLVPQTPGGLGAAPHGGCTRAAVLRTRRTCRAGVPARQTTPQRYFAVCGGVAPGSNTSARMTRLTKAKRQTRESEMYHRDVIAYIARRLPHRTRRDVAEVIEVLTEVWSEQLIKGSEVIVPSIGRLSIEVQNMKAGGLLAQHGRLRRVYGRFRPTESLKERVEEVDLEQT